MVTCRLEWPAKVWTVLGGKPISIRHDIAKCRSACQLKRSTGSLRPSIGWIERLRNPSHTRHEQQDDGFRFAVLLLHTSEVLHATLPRRQHHPSRGRLVRLAHDNLRVRIVEIAQACCDRLKASHAPQAFYEKAGVIGSIGMVSVLRSGMLMPPRTVPRSILIQRSAMAGWSSRPSGSEIQVRIR
jgi:hypothetical protein